MIGRAALFTAGMILLLGKGQALAQPDGGSADTAARAGILSVHATAHRQVANSVASVTLGVEVHGRDVPTTLGPLAERSKALLAYLQGQRVDRLGSDQVDLTPETQEQHGQPDRITGYTARQTITFQIDPAKLPSVVGDALAHGANTLQQVGLTPRDADMETARQELAIEATRQAITQVKAVADAADQRVLSLAEIDVAPQGGNFRPLMQAPMLARVAAAPALPITAGQTEVSIQVDVKARILPKTPGLVRQRTQQGLQQPHAGHPIRILDVCKSTILAPVNNSSPPVAFWTQRDASALRDRDSLAVRTAGSRRRAAARAGWHGFMLAFAPEKMIGLVLCRAKFRRLLHHARH